MTQIKKVIVVHKTHLDIGFTDTAHHVLERYVNEFIPRAIETACLCNQNGQKNFVWTVGSFLIKYYLEHANPSDTKRLIQAISDGYIVWHGLACTTHTELMDKELFQYDLQISRQLDERFGKHTIAAKMTDVPCHTHTIVPYLAQNGICYLHIGINRSSRPLQIPQLCRLQYGNEEIILNYDAAYGAATVFGEYALEFAHTADNMGPPSPEKVFAEMNRLRVKYPGAEIVSGTMDEFASLILPEKEKLPVITSEPGDTWIHGVASDPWKSAALRELFFIRDLWTGDNVNARSGKDYDAFMLPLLLVCEHTWGLDTKLFPCDYKNWSKSDFTKVRRTSAFATAEASWQEQRQYLEDAIAMLPAPYQSMAHSRLADLHPVFEPIPAVKDCPNLLEINGYRIRLLENGAISILQKPDSTTCSDLILGETLYSVYDARTVDHCYYDYNCNIEETKEWSRPDFAKPGLECVPNLKTHTWNYTLKATKQEGNLLTLSLEVDSVASDTYGAPRHVHISYLFESQITVTVQWFHKDASRIPEAIFFGFHLGIDDPGKLTVTKLGLPVNPYDVCSGGNRKLHAITALTCDEITIRNLHAPLLSVGGPHLYDTEDAFPPVENGMYYVLFNNRWGTNFPQWYEENASFTFILTL